MSLWQDAHRHNKSNLLNKFSHYFPIYEKEFSEWKNKSVTILEIGVSQGGSLQMWRRFFGPFSKIIGIDINSRYKKLEEEGIYIRIGDQSDVKFLETIISEFGVPDIIIDDGSHIMDHVIKSFEFLYPKLSKNGIYVVEDLHTAYNKKFGGGLESTNNFVNISKDFIDQLYALYSKDLTPDFITYNTLGISFYNSMIFFKRGNVHPIIHELVGKPDVIYRLSKLIPDSLKPIAQKVRRIIKGWVYNLIQKLEHLTY